MYVHGFLSSAQTGTVTILRRLLPGATVFADDLPIHPHEAMRMLNGLCEERRPDLIIGTSMGGMYAEMLRGYDRILVNPAFNMSAAMRQAGLTGMQRYRNPRRDGARTVLVNKALEKEYDVICAQCFQNIDAAERTRVWGLFGDRDPLVHTFDIFRGHYPQALHFHGEHRLNESVVTHALVPVIRWIDDRQEHRERPIIYISVETLTDGPRPVARSCMLKAFEYLLESYTIYIIAPAPTNDFSVVEKSEQIIEELLSTAAHNHIVFTNNPRLLYGDYIISSRDVRNDFATTLRFGSAEMKTWEDVMVYFSRLRGQ